MAHAGGGAVFAADVTPAELAARPRQPKQKRKESSSAQYARTANKWWPAFTKAAGWDPKEKLNFLDASGNPIDGTFRQLFIWLYEQNVTKGVFKPMLAWAQATLNEQLAARLLPLRPEYVCKLPGVIERKDEIFTNARQCHMEHMTDLQAAVESDLGPVKMAEMVRVCLNVDVPGTSPLFCMQILFELRATHQQAARHDDLRGERFAHMFARCAEKVGPRGMPMLCNVTNGGKTNNNGRVMYSAVLPHRNPLFCSMFAKGALLLWRFLVRRRSSAQLQLCNLSGARADHGRIVPRRARPIRHFQTRRASSSRQ